MHSTVGGVDVTLQMVKVASCETQHKRDRSLLANFTWVTAAVCWKFKVATLIQQKKNGCQMNTK